MIEMVTEDEIKKLASCLVGKTIKLITMNKDKSIVYFQQLDDDNNYIVLMSEDDTLMTFKDATMLNGRLVDFYDSPIVAVDYSRVTVFNKDMDIYTLTTENNCTLCIKCDIQYNAVDITPIQREYDMQYH